MGNVSATSSSQTGDITTPPPEASIVSSPPPSSETLTQLQEELPVTVHIPSQELSANQPVLSSPGFSVIWLVNASYVMLQYVQNQAIMLDAQQQKDAAIAAAKNALNQYKLALDKVASINRQATDQYNAAIAQANEARTQAICACVTAGMGIGMAAFASIKTTQAKINQATNRTDAGYGEALRVRLGGKLKTPNDPKSPMQLSADIKKTALPQSKLDSLNQDYQTLKTVVDSLIQAGQQFAVEGYQITAADQNRLATGEQANQAAIDAQVQNLSSTSQTVFDNFIRGMTDMIGNLVQARLSSAQMQATAFTGAI